MEKSFLLLAICWLLIVGLLGLLAVVSNGAIVLRRRWLWVLIAEREGVQQAKKVFLFASIICLFSFLALILIYLFTVLGELSARDARVDFQIGAYLLQEALHI